MRRLYEDLAYEDTPRADCAWRLDTDWPAVTGDIDTDVAVIGAGYTGLSTALHLAEAGVQVTVLEAKSPGWGASGRNGGFCCIGGAKLSHDTIARRFGADQSTLWMDAQREAIHLVRDLLDRHGIDARTHSEGELQLAHRPRVWAGFGAEKAWYESQGIKADLLPPEALAERGLNMAESHGGLHVHLGFALDAGEWAQGLARATQRAGADIRGASPVTSIRREAGRYRLTTPGGIVTADRIVIATNGYSSEDLPPWLAGRTLPVASSVIMTRPLSAAEQAAQGWSSDLMAYDSRELLHYFRLLPDGRFLFGMRGGSRATPAMDARIRRLIHQDFARMFPAWAEVETPHFWSGFVNLARKLTPFVGPIPGMENAWTGMAYHGNGVAMATYSGRLLAALVQGQTPNAPYPAMIRRPLGRFPLGLQRRWILDVTYRWFGLTDRL